MTYTFDLGALLGLLVASVGGVWAIRRYLQARRAERAQWLHRIFSNFYLDPELRSVRKAIVYGDTALAELVERRV